MQDSFNLAWKLATVLRGQAGPELLETYNAERVPVGRQIVERANLSRDQFGPIFEALGIAGGSDDEGITRGLASCREENASGEKRRLALTEAVQLKNYEFNAHGVELNQRHRSSAVLTEPGEEIWQHDPELHHQRATRPGAKLPHVWLVDTRGRRVSTLDLVGRGEFSLVTGLSGTAWSPAVQRCREQLRLPLRLVRIGTPEARDAYGDWRRICEIEEPGCLLVRPDGYIAWRSTSGPGSTEEAQQQLQHALDAVLQHP